MNSENIHKTTMTKPSQIPPAHFLIYENLNLVADNKISKEHISIGRSRNADVVLDHCTVADIHAFIHFEGPQAFLTNRYPDNGMHLNGQSVHLSKLNNEDVIAVGPYALKVKMGATDASTDQPEKGRYSVTLINRYKCDSDLQDAAIRLAKLFRADPVKMALAIGKPEYVIKKELSKVEGERWQIALQKAGIFCDLRVMPDPAPQPIRSSVIEKAESKHPPVETKHSDQTPTPPVETKQSDQTPTPSVETKQSDQTPTPADIGPGTDTEFYFEADEEEDEEDLWEAPFSLKDQLDSTKTKRKTSMRMPSHLQVVKSSGDRVQDVFYLDSGQKYRISTAEGKHCLARQKGEKGHFAYIGRNFSGYINNAKGETIADLDSYKTPDYLFKKRQRIYRIPVPDTGEVVVSEGPNQYRIFNAVATSSPTVRVAERPSEFSWRHWAFSASIHLVLALCISIYWYFQIVSQKPAGPHFVKIDPSLIQQLQPKKIPEPPKKVEPPKPEPVKVAKKVEPIKKRAERKKPPKRVKPAKTNKKIKRTAKAAQSSRHPKAGGGFGNGNVRNRNINQTGLLSVIGPAPAAAQSATIASVTNLDAVPVPGATENNFTVGGVKGSLGNGKISVAGGKMLQTKGSKQVFRSAGASGPGHVAALEKGTTGKKQVQAMVSAKMSRTVKIRGGMSREMVKQVIDQHLEEITYCYETALMSNPAIMGRIVFEWKILMSGRVGQVRIVASSVNSHEVHNCIKSAIQSWQFPKPSGAEVVVSYPFVFDLVAF